MEGVGNLSPHPLIGRGLPSPITRAPSMQFPSTFHRLSCAIAVVLSAPALACAAEMTTTTLDSVNVQATHAAAPGSLNEQRLSNSVNSVMSKQEIDAIPSGGIADVVAHMPGLSSYSDMHLGQATTGENAYVSIRGMDASYNAYTLNGFGMPETDSSTRAISLNMLAPVRHPVGAGLQIAHA